jgi:periplasmic copper chaperone A
MIRTIWRAALAAAVLSLTTASGHAHDSHTETVQVIRVGDLEISGAFTRATLPSQPVGGGYLTITNTGESDDTLIGGSATFAERVEVHEMSMVNDVMNMRQLADGLVIPAGESVSLQPGGYHLMFVQLAEPLVVGEPVMVTLEFENAGTIEIEFAVVAPGTHSTPAGHDHSGHSAPEEGGCDHDGHHAAH